MDETSCGSKSGQWRQTFNPKRRVVRSPCDVSTFSQPRDHEAVASAMLKACQGRLAHLNWFRTDWQRGGALTGIGEYTPPDSETLKVVVKLPVSSVEHLWLQRLQQAENVAPRLLASGPLSADEFGHLFPETEHLLSREDDTPLCKETVQGDVPIESQIASSQAERTFWVVMDYLPHGPLSRLWKGHEFDLLIQAAGRWAKAASAYPVDQPPPVKDWLAIHHRARQFVHRHNLQHEQRWNKALKKVQRKLPSWLDQLAQRPTLQWCHGDLHLGNALTRVPPPGGPALLIDFACVHAGHWLDDAVSFEHLYWARPKRLGKRKICSLIAKERHAQGLPVEPAWPIWANIQRCLLAMSTPAMLEHDGHQPHVQAALKILETHL